MNLHPKEHPIVETQVLDQIAKYVKYINYNNLLNSHIFILDDDFE